MTKGYKRKTAPKYKISNIVLLIITLICVSINIVLFLNKILIPKKNEQKQFEEQISNKEENSSSNTNKTTSAEYQLSQLKQGTERDRIEYYCGQFFKYIENQNYEKAYELLYPEFKEQYFPTIEEFEKYVQKTYPSTLAIIYDDFDRQGNIYVTTVKIDDALATNNKKQFSQRIIVQESDYNKYVLSFQVI